MNKLSQTWIIIFGGSAIWFIGRPEQWACYGYVFGLISQPAWFYTSLRHRQFGIFLLSLFYTYSWCQGVYFHIIKGL